MSDTGLALNQDFKERVTNKVRDVFMELISEETLTELVNAEIKAFFEVESSTYTSRSLGGYGNQREFVTSCTPFRLIVWEEVRKQIQPKLQEVFDSDAWKTETFWVGNEQQTQINELLEKKLESMVTKMAASMFHNMFAQAVQGAKWDLQNDVQTILQNAGVNSY